MALLIIPFGMSCITFMAYIFLKSRQTERLALLEKGLEPDMFSANKNGIWPALRLGMLLIGIGFGLYAGSQVSVDLLDKGIGLTAGALMFGGLALVLNFGVEKKWRQ